MDEPAPAPPQAGFNWGLALVPIVLLSLFMWWLAGRKPAEEPVEQVAAGDQAFNVDEVPQDEPEPAPVPAGRYVSQAEREAEARVAGAGPGLSGFVPEKDKIFFKDPKTQEEDARAREKEFIRKYDPLIRAEQERLSRITRRYQKKEPVVREVDAAFGKLPRYMALKAQYEKDRDAYAFVRGAVGLPEVRKTVWKYATNADVWRVTVGMVSEGLKQKPPKPVYDEAKRFLTEDKKVALFVTDLTGYVTPRVGTLLPQVMRPGQDLKPLQDLAKDLNIAAGPKVDLKQARQAAGNASQYAPR